MYCNLQVKNLFNGLVSMTDIPKPQMVLPLSPRKQFENAANISVQPLSPKRPVESPLQINASKSSTSRISVKGYSVKKALAENSPVKRSPVMKLHKQDGEYTDLRWPTLISVAQRSAHCRHSTL